MVAVISGQRKIEAYITKKGRNHTATDITQKKAAAILKTSELVLNAEYSFSSPHDVHSKSGEANISVWDYFVSAADFGGENIPVVFALRESENDVRAQIYKIAVQTKEDALPHDSGYTSVDVGRITGLQHLPKTKINDTGDFVNNEGDKIQNSITISDSDYLDLAKNPEKNRAKLQETVDQAADSWGAYKENGKILRMYHGATNGDYWTFDRYFAHPGGNSGAGFYFTTLREDAESNYADVEGADNYFKWSNLADHTLGKIASANKTTVAKIVKANGILNANLIHVAEKLIIV